jgi:hypothetical protein
MQRGKLPPPSPSLLPSACAALPGLRRPPRPPRTPSHVIVRHRHLRPRRLLRGTFAA